MVSLEKNIKYVYFILFVTIILKSILLIVTISNNPISYSFGMKNIIGLLLVVIIGILFLYKFALGRIFITLFFIAGVLNFVSLSPIESTVRASFGIIDLNIPVFSGNLTFFFWLVIHLIVSHKIFYGILQKEYWDNL